MERTGIVKRLRAYDYGDPEPFAALVDDAMSVFRIDVAELTDHFDCNFPTLRHWRSGKRRPVPAVRKMVVEWLLKRCTCTCCGDVRTGALTCGDRACTGDEYGDG